MKRCIVCGNTEDNNNTVCNICGGSFVDIPGDTSSEEMVAETTMEEEETVEVMSEEVSEEIQEETPEEMSEEVHEEAAEPQKPEAPAAAVQEPVQQRKMKSGPQIYGQAGMTQKNGNPYNAQQGMVRRNIQGGAPQGRPMQGVSYGRYRMQIMETARGMLKSPLFFLIVLLNTVYLAGSIAAIFMKELNFSLYAGLLADIEFPAQVAGYMTDLLAIFAKLDTGAVIVNLVIHIPDMLFCLGVWVIFISALAAKERMSGAGFGMVKVVMILRMVVYCILMLAGLLVSVTLVVAAWISGVQSMLIASVVTLVLMIVITMMLIMYYFSYFATMKTCRVNADNGDVYGSVSSYVAGLQILMALFSVINLLSGIVNAEISNIAGSVGKMGWMILLGIWMFRYKNKLSEFDEQ